MKPTPIFFFLASLFYPTTYGAANFFFNWPTNTSSCETVTLTWSGGVMPFTAWVVPVYGQPFFYELSTFDATTGFGSAQIELQLAAGVNYVVVVSDGNGIGTGGSSEIQTVQSSNDTSCLTYANSRSVSLDFTFTVSGQAVQCERGFETSWSGGSEYGPYNFTTIAMDQSFIPYDVPMEKGVTSQSDWLLDMPAQSRFIIMYNSAQGYGRGGTSGIYSVSPGNDTSCLKNTPQPTGAWPSTITTGTLDAATLAITETAFKGGDHSGISGGAIAGIVIGALAGVALVGLLLWFLLRRRKTRAQGRLVGKSDVSHIDLAGDDDSIRRGGQPMVEPYRELGSFNPPEGHGHGRISPNNSYLPSSDSRDSSAGFAGLGAATALGGIANIGDRHGNNSGMELSLLDENNSPSVPGVAGPLPSKSNNSMQTSTPNSPSAPTNPNYPQPPSLPYTAHHHHSSSSHSANSNSNILPADDPTKSASSPTRQAYPSYNDRPQSGGMRVTNPEHPENLPALPPGATHGLGHAPRNAAPRRRPADGNGPTFRRHADAGRFQEEIVDLPPLYSEVPRDGPGIPSPASERSSDR
ncbi:uncharacterized protein I303_102959 [Kwoniella dejecticola CBS 10117]|uniref:Fibronectin type-III domain-containing protein n=1 Tax=Kwoniella dejecticola CBS 10117 TaxID=1296121 RepID=A0A1A6AA72_9TREE|nr:uncharacterized protein I303_02978 [Kwoniella dejecticola CBS 10117]OBR86956.1 hypothetical protein I303_02978 [Kwoniella dejecticola CBS 10117]